MRRRLLAVASRSARVPAVLAAASRTVLNGAWLGLLAEDEIADLDRRYYEQAGEYRSVAWNEQGLFDWERRFVDEHLVAGQRVVVLAAGGGREVLGLLGLGFDAVGYEPHPGLLAAGNDLLAGHGHPGRLRRARRDELPPDAGEFDALVVGWGAYSLLRDRPHRVALLAAARTAMPADGVVLLSFLQRAADDRELRWTAGIANAERRVRRAEPVAVGDTLAPNRVHLFSAAEVAEEVAEAGLVLASTAVTGRADASTTYVRAVARVP